MMELKGARALEEVGGEKCRFGLLGKEVEEGMWSVRVQAEVFGHLGILVCRLGMIHPGILIH